MLLLALMTAPVAAGQDLPAGSSGFFFLSVVSGTYAEDQFLSAEPQGVGISLRYSIRDPEGAEGPWVPLREPLLLGAARGEEREYRVIVRADSAGGEQERREVRMVIDRRPPAPPRILPESGVVWEPTAVRFETGSAGDRVFYAVQGDVTVSPVGWDGKSVIVGTPSARGDYVVQAYSVDPAGHRSALVSARYTVDARMPSLQIVSPVSGDFANPQALALTFRNVLWVRYSLDGSDPAAGGTSYTGPVIIRVQGTRTIRVAAQPRAASLPVLRQQVTWTYLPDGGAGLLLDSDSGTYSKGVQPRLLSSPPGTLYYTLWEKTPTGSDFIAGTSIALAGNPSAPSAIALRLRALSDSGLWGREYRYFYFLGPTAPAAPSIFLFDTEPLRVPARVQAIAPEDSLLVVTTDGSRPNASAASGSGIVDLKPLPGVAAVSVKAMAVNGSGAVSVIAERRITQDTDPGARPVLTRLPGQPAANALVSTASRESRDYVYEITSDGSDPPLPTASSPRLFLPLPLVVPYGMARTFRLRAAALDAGGRVLSASDTFAVAVNRKPPGPPLLTPKPGGNPFEEPGSLAISSPARVLFAMTADGTTPKDPASDQGSGVTTISLPGVEGQAVTYRLKLVAVDAAGNASEVYGPYSYTVDLRSPRLPAISGIENGGRYSVRQLSPVVADSPWKITYTLTTDGSMPPDPDASSPQFTSATRFTAEEGSIAAFHVKMLAVSANGKRIGEKRDLVFVMDLKAPDVPLLSGMTNGARYSAPVTVTPGSAPDNVRLYYSVSTSETDPPDPVTAGERLAGPVSFDAPDGVRRDFSIRVASIDDAGNRSLYDQRYRFSIDRAPPDDPRVIGAPGGGLASSAVTLTLEAPGSSIVYEMTDDGSEPRLPTPSSPRYTSPLLLAGRPGASVTYRLLARAINDLGNASRGARTVALTVDKTVPSVPPAPRLIHAPENASVAYLVWDQPTAGRLLYRLSPGAKPSGEFMPYVGPVSISLTPAMTGDISVEAVIENAAGTRGPTGSYKTTVAMHLAAPVVRGAKDGGIYTQKVELRIGAPAGEVRYEIATDGGYPPAVTPTSPLAPASLVLEVADGQTLAVRVSARAFDPSGAALASPEADIGLTLDRTPPDPPVASGIEDRGYYSDARSFSLLSSDGTIYYSVTRGQEVNIPARTEPSRYRGDLTLDAVTGEQVQYNVVAYTVDSAGNQSRETRSWTVTIDQKAVYVSQDGNDYAEGTRLAPVQSLSKALLISAATTRKTVYMAAGSYVSDARIVLPDAVTIVGGLDRDTWAPLGLERMSTLSTASPWRSGDALITLAGGKVSIGGLEMRDALGAVPNLLAVSGGELVLENDTFTMIGSVAETGIRVEGGALTLRNSRLAAMNVRQGALLALTGGSAEVLATSFFGPSSAADFACIDAADAPSLALTGVTIAPGGGKETRGIRAARSSIVITGGRIQSGTGTIEAISVDAKDSDVAISDTDIQSPSESQSSTGILGIGARLLVQRSRIAIAGTARAVGINAIRGELVLSRSSITASPTGEYIALLMLEDTDALVANNVLTGGDAAQTVGVASRGGSVDFVNNTLLAGTGGTLTAGILVQGDVAPRIVNNIIVRAGADEGNAILVMGASSSLLAQASSEGGLIVLTNCFGGWQQILHVDYGKSSYAEPVQIGRVTALNGVDGNSFEGPISGNIAESPTVTFQGLSGLDLRVTRDSAGVNSGTDLSVLPWLDAVDHPAEGIDLTADFVGRPRPARQQLSTPGPPRGWDMGAYEFFE